MVIDISNAKKNDCLNEDAQWFNEAVEFLEENYDLTEEEAIIVVEDYLDEASAKDAARVANQGERIQSQKRGMRIANHELNNPNMAHTKLTRQYDELVDDGKGGKKQFFTKAAEDYSRADKINLDKVNNVKEKTYKEKLRDSTRAGAGSVPEYGANPKYSKDADPKAVEAYYRSRGKNPYKNFDIEKSTEGMDKKKAEMVKRAMQRGSKLPDSIKNKLVKKDDDETPSRKSIDPMTTYGNYHNSISVYTDPKDYEKQRNNLLTMRQTTDPTAYHKARKDFLKNMGDKNYKGSILYPMPVADAEGNRGFLYVAQDKNEEVREDRTKKSKKKNKIDYYHVSSNSNIKKLVPSPKSAEGIFHPQSRIYASRGTPTARNGSDLDKDKAELYGYKRYKLKNINNKKIYKDGMTDDGKRSSFIKTSKAIDVEDIDK